MSAANQTTLTASQLARQHWLGVLAKVPAEQLQQQWAALDLTPDYQLIRPPEIGLTMVRARVGGSGQPFNMAEMTITRCAIRLTSGTLGVSYVAGRDKRKALTVALADALLQEDTDQQLQQQLVVPLEASLQAAADARAADASQTKVDFFTLVRGEDE
ncbi:phosphonate C-P lyase system protein PhnG [Neptunomonas marina]|uniref:Phosphonate C-P lyase system protein PhnG n=1 Tax=Neptunomonas marina TaxID=1815562 RepID=A0A437Q5C3_9GAMM|nr:phosphonate C-P lyase system protein PhnG [Neptunomonas marina]RVU29703.1 phosphonate C-P lyase system protein PhnG [Neptunomonas marina]